MDDVLGQLRLGNWLKLELLPLHMRGRTLGKCFTLLDEAQNTANPNDDVSY